MRDNYRRSHCIANVPTHVSISSTSEEVRDLIAASVANGERKKAQVSISSTSEEVRDRSESARDNGESSEFPLVPLPKKCVTKA